MFKESYKFPVINHIDDVLPHIEGEDAFRIIRKDGIVTIDYAILHSDVFRPLGGGTEDEELTKRIRRECRGISFDEKTGIIIRRPLHKFFNINEREETLIENIDIKNSFIMDKLDGSNISTMIHEGSSYFGTRAGVTDVSKMATEWYNNIKTFIDYEALIYHWEERGYTVIFEFWSTDNQIVIDYGDSYLKLIAIRHRVTGEYVHPTVMAKSAVEYGVPYVAYAHASMYDLDLDNLRKHVDIEGWVFRDGNGHMVKFKTEWYCALHGLSTNFVRARDIIRIWIDGNLDDLYPNMSKARGDKIRDYMTWFEDTLDNAVDSTTKAINATLREGDDKATWAKRHFKYNRDISGYVFKLLEETGGKWNGISVTRTSIMKEMLNHMYGRTSSNKTWDSFLKLFPEFDKELKV